MAKRKTLGQICYESFLEDIIDTCKSPWPKVTTRKEWERAAAAVEAEVLRRLDIDKEVERRLNEAAIKRSDW